MSEGRLTADIPRAEATQEAIMSAAVPRYPPGRGRRMNVLRSILLRREAGILVMIVLFCLAVGVVKPQFLTLDSLRIILLLTPLIMIGAMGQMLVIVARHVDLSIGSMLGFSAMVAGMMFKFDPEIWWPLGFVARHRHRRGARPRQRRCW